MNVSAINATPLKPAFAGLEQDDNGLKNVNTVLTQSSDLADSFQKDGEKKSKIGTIISVAGAFASMFALGKLGATAILKKFPSLTEKLPNLAKKALTGAKGMLDKAKTTKFGTKISTSKLVGHAKSQATKLAEKPLVKRINTSLSEMVTPCKDKIKNLPIDKKIKNLAGLASMGVFGSQVVTVDKNKNGIKDIAEDDINAYTNAMGVAKLVSEIAEALV